MRALAYFFLACAIGVAAGVGLSALSLLDGSVFDVAAIGPWRVAAKAGAADADPYTRASLERSGEIPLALGEGLQFIARTDDSGSPLRPDCAYLVGARAPASRFWSLGVVDRKGFPIENAAHRYVFRSSEILRDGAGGFEIAVSSEVRAGNWLPVGPGGAFALALRLYDSPLGATAIGIDASALPRIAKERCR